MGNKSKAFLLSLALATPALAVASRGTWHVNVSPSTAKIRSIISGVAQPVGGVAYARGLLDALHIHGYEFEHITVDMPRHDIDIAISKFGKSKLGSFLPAVGKPVSRERIRRSMPLLTAAAVARDEKLNLNIPQGGEATITTSDAHDAISGGIVASSSGPRYAGSDVAAGYILAHGDGFDVSASITRGLPGLSPKQAAGGAYLGEALAIDRPTPWGIFSANLSHAHYLVGGPDRSLGLKGTVTQIRLGDRYPVLAGAAWLRGGVYHDHQVEGFGVVGWDSTQDTTGFYVGATSSFRLGPIGFGLRGTIMHGLNGAAGEKSGPPLLGAFQNDYSIERVRAAFRTRLGPIAVHGVFGAQHGSMSTPQVLLAFTGGQHRGSSFFTGSFAGPSGFWYSGTASKAVPWSDHLAGYTLSTSPFVSLNGGSVFPSVGPSISIASASVGVSGQITRRVSYRLGYSHTIAAPRDVHQSSLFNFLVSVAF